VTDAPEPQAGGFAAGEHVFPLRVYYEDTDFTGVVYHANYLRFFERGRTECLRAAGVGHAELLESADPCAFAVTRMAIAFRRPAHIDDALTVRTRLKAAGRIRLAADQRLLRGDDLLADADVEIVCIRPGGGPRRLPTEIARRLASIPVSRTP
jgi:acyl-CoA thioester hydrolase